MTLVVQDRGASSGTVLGAKTGASPLEIELPKLALQGHVTVLLAGPGESDDEGTAWAQLSGSPQDQPWKLAGTATVMPR